MASFLLDDLADLLSSGGVTATVYRGFMPEQPDDAVQLVLTGGIAPARAMRSQPGQPVEERPGVQVVVRSPSLQRAVATSNFIWRLLDGLGDRDINGTRYYWVAARQSPFQLPRDGSQRSLMAFNIDVAKAVSTATST